MSVTHGPPLLLSVLLGPLLGALAWGLWRSRRSDAPNSRFGVGDDVLTVFLLLAALAIGALLAYIFIGVGD
jgi:hypothetical protein